MRLEFHPEQGPLIGVPLDDLQRPVPGLDSVLLQVVPEHREIRGVFICDRPVPPQTRVAYVGIVQFLPDPVAPHVASITNPPEGLEPGDAVHFHVSILN